MEQWVREIKVFFDKKRVEIYPLPGTEDEIEEFFNGKNSAWVTSESPMILRIVLITQSVSPSTIMLLLANSQVQSFASLASARFRTEDRLGAKPPDTDRKLKVASSRRKTTIFTRKWCLLTFDEVHEYRGERSRQFIGAVAIAQCASAVVGVSATPVMSNAKVCRSCGLPGGPSDHCHLLRTFSTSRAFFGSPVATASKGRSWSWSTTGTSTMLARERRLKIARKPFPRCRRPFKREQRPIVPRTRW